MKIKIPGKCDGCSCGLPKDAHKNVRYCSDCRPPFVPKPARNIDASGQHVCEQCSTPLFNVRPSQRFCDACKSIRRSQAVRASSEKNGSAAAYAVMRQAIRLGLLAHPKNFRCVDCGWPAHCYDHRDYNKPLDVDPVCTTCNINRGSAKPFAPVDDPYLAANPEQRKWMSVRLRKAVYEEKYPGSDLVIYEHPDGPSLIRPSRHLQDANTSTGEKLAKQVA